MTLTELKEQVAEHIKKSQEEASNKSEEMQLVAQLNLLKSDSYKESLAKQYSIESTVDRLKSLITQCETVVNTIPVYDSVKKQDKKYNGRPLYGYGIVMTNLYKLISGVMYSTTQHKELMLSITGLSEPVVESLVKAFGSPAYYSIRNSKMVEAIPFDSATINALLPIVAINLGIDIDVNDVNPSIMTHNFNADYERALQQQSEVELTQLAKGTDKFTMD